MKLKIVLISIEYLCFLFICHSYMWSYLCSYVIMKHVKSVWGTRYMWYYLKIICLYPCTIITNKVFEFEHAIPQNIRCALDVQDFIRYFHHAKISLFNFFEKKTNNIHCTCSKIFEFLKVSFQNRYWYFKATHSSLSKNIISRVKRKYVQVVYTPPIR